MNITSLPSYLGMMLCFWTIYMPYIHRLTQTALFLFSTLIHSPGMTVTIVLLHHNPLYHCMIRSDSSTPCPCTITSVSARYNLLLVQLSLVDLHLPLLSFTYISSYNEGYLNCTSRTLGP